MTFESRWSRARVINLLRTREQPLVDGNLTFRLRFRKRFHFCDDEE